MQIRRRDGRTDGGRDGRTSDGLRPTPLLFVLRMPQSNCITYDDAGWTVGRCSGESVPTDGAATLITSALSSRDHSASV